MKLSFKNRIAFLNILAVALTMALAFIAIYLVVSISSYQHLDDDINMEKEAVLKKLSWKEDLIDMEKMSDWEEEEHMQLQVNPTFIQIVDQQGITIFKSASLKGDRFAIDPNIRKAEFYNSLVHQKKIRQGQFPIYNESNKIIGHLAIGISQQESAYVLRNLFIVLSLTYVITLAGLYLVISFVASKAIAPVKGLITTASQIDSTNIQARLPLPENEDEIYQLAATINELLNRLELSFHQQKQFTADIAHEMRTPLAAIKGMLEVLIRKKRTAEQFELKIKEVIGQTDRLSVLFDQLLQLARLESGTVTLRSDSVLLKNVVDHIERTYHSLIQNNHNQFQSLIPAACTVRADRAMLERILDNLILNAIKYNKPGGSIICKWDDQSNTLTITDEGIGISKEHLPHVFNRFYRADDSRSSQVPGTGLGLAIVKKLCDLQKIKISAESIPEKGTSFILEFSS